MASLARRVSNIWTHRSLWHRSLMKTSAKLEMVTMGLSQSLNLWRSTHRHAIFEQVSSVKSLGHSKSIWQKLLQQWNEHWNVRTINWLPEFGTYSSPFLLHLRSCSESPPCEINCGLHSQKLIAFAGICGRALCTQIHVHGWLGLEDEFVIHFQVENFRMCRTKSYASNDACYYEKELTVARGGHRVSLSRNCHSNWFEQLVYSCSVIWEALALVRVNIK